MKETILFAEDEGSIRSPLLALLQRSGYNVIVAVDGLDALERARNHNGEIHLLLCDVLMPRMSGVELATRLCIERPEIAILLISGFDSGMLVLHHGWQVLTKPCEFQILKQKIQAMLDDKRKLGRDHSYFESSA